MQKREGRETDIDEGEETKMNRGRSKTRETMKKSREEKRRNYEER